MIPQTAAPVTLQQAYDRVCVQITEAYTTIRFARKQLREALKQRDLLIAESAQANAAQERMKAEQKNDGK